MNLGTLKWCKMNNKLSITFFLFFLSQASFAEPLRFSLHKIESGIPGPTLLIIGGFQGDEPGGFTAA